MKQTRKKYSAAVSVLLKLTALLMVLACVAGCSSAKQEPQKAQTEAVSVKEDKGGYPSAYQIHFEQAWKKNQDFKGYLTLEGSALSTNVVQGTDNTYYAQHGFDGSSGSSAAYLDYRANIELPSSQLVIYLPDAAHNEMFDELANFKDLEFYRDHPVISFNNLYRNAKYKVFSVVVLPSGYDQVPYQSCMDTNDRGAFVTLVQKALDHSLLDIPVDVWDTDELLTIVSEDRSLVDENGKNAQILVFARKIRDGESETVNVQKASVYPNSYLPASWYDQILRSQYASTVMREIRKEAAGWFSSYELSKIADADLERMMNTRQAEYKKYLNDKELLLSAEEKTYLYEKRLAEAQNPVVTLDIQNLTARVGDELMLYATRSPLDSEAKFTWTSNNDAVVSVAGNGNSAKITARKEGTATVTVSSGKVSASCVVEVRAKEQFVLNPSNKTIYEDETYTIQASSNIQKAVSSNTNVARVTFNKNIATVTGVGEGSATITVTGQNGLSATCKVTVHKYNLVLDQTNVTLEKGTKKSIYVTSGEATNWYISNLNVVNLSVVENGRVARIEAIGTGTATITATSRNGMQASCNITVTDGSVAFSTTHMDMHKGEFREMYVTRGNVTKWDVSDKSVAQICIYGDGSYVEVEAVGYGNATVYAYGSDGSVASLTVTVSAPQESLAISPYSMTVTKGELRNISVTRGHASNWVSSNPNVAEIYVLGDGSMAQVEGRNPGTATITVYDNYGGWVNCNVTVEAPAQKLVIGPGTVYMNVGDWEDISVASGTAVDWSSSNNNVVGVYTVGGDTQNVRIKANGAGTAQVIAYAADGSTAVCNVTVEAPHVEELRLSKSSMTVTAEEWYDLYVSSGYAVDWSSSNPDVVGVYVIGGNNNNVQIKGKQAGTATITAYAADGCTASCTVTVENPYVPPVTADPLKLDRLEITIEEGDWGEIHVVSGRCVEWNSSNKNIVRIYGNDDVTMIRIKGEAAGTADIIAYAENGTTTVCKVTVKPYRVTQEIVGDSVYQEEETFNTAMETVYVPETETGSAPETTEVIANESGDT